MQNLYATRLVARDPGRDTFRLMAGVVRWWGCRPRRAPDTGEGELVVGDRGVRWATRGLGDGSADLFDLELRRPSGTHNVVWESRVSVTRTAEATQAFVALSRVSADNRLGPAPINDFQPPRVVRELLRAVPCLARAGMPLSAEPRTVTTADVDALVADLVDPRRGLPLIVVAGRARLAVRIAHANCGLAHVVLLDDRAASDALTALCPDARLPWEGVRLFWPGFGDREDVLHHPWWTSSAAAENNHRFVHHLFAKLARLSVLAEPRDEVRDEILGALRRARLTALESDSEYALELLRQNEALESQVERLRAEVHWYHAEFQRFGRDRAALGPDDAVERAPLDERDFGALWDQLTRQSDGAIVFTENARRSWAKCEYAEPTRMRKALRDLAMAAAEWRGQRGRIGMGMERWLAERYGLNYAPTDRDLCVRRLDRFEYDGVRRSRERHVKLGDNTSWEYVGRIYFDVDFDELRWIVDHVGLKLYRR
ncbi:hypothetical protein LX15_004236 [Streptoalloteichus tenebrarius]|uniref:Uncharacterized protein n=1 Tax=Streptoalloteichus tenebrarius (strain ATCC 17920 / DSM 40477 / JCM 4838 / CBS 697.72 / NBRC 16177 / NCIMB 11028 / NRRL B-12390 / A12253. 1 / ISP 5477) TaxID=1933 RepID=A0ABT1HYB3_STRSD|nr:hypothetical protein [Streptoalloteichus tenebrarius]MCP2260518.1 hypothetical protein [Streptoalloteichus tenebrarius]